MGGLMSVLVRSVQGYMSRFVGLGRRSWDHKSSCHCRTDVSALITAPIQYFKCILRCNLFRSLQILTLRWRGPNLLKWKQRDQVLDIVQVREKLANL